MRDYFNEVKIVLDILPLKLRKKIKLIIGLLSISGFLESLSIGLFIPLIAIISEGRISFSLLNDFLNIEKINIVEILPIIIILIFFIYLIKSLFLTYLEFITQNLVNNVKAELTSALFKKYINSSYKFHLKNNSAVLLRNLTSEVIAFSNGIVHPILLISKEFFIITFLIILIFIFDYKVSFFVISFGAILILSFRFLLKKILYKLAKKRMDYRGKENKTILESLQGIKFVKSYNIENNFISKLIPILEVTANLKSKETTVKVLPRIWIELIMLILLGLIGSYYFFFEKGMNAYISFISLFLITMIRMLPSFIATTNSINTYQSYKPSIDFIKKELRNNDYEEENIDEKKIENNLIFNQDLKIQNIDFRYDDKKLNILENLNLKINKKDDLIGIYGESGVGKTTLIDILMGLHKPQKGKFYIDDTLVKQNFMKGKIFGYVPQSIYLFDDSIKNNILMGQQLEIKDEDYQKILNQSDLSKFINSLSEGDNTLIGENGAQISGGQKQRIGIARALANNAQLLILDEATSGLDKKSEENILDTIKKISKEKSVLIITHNRKILDYCNSIYCLKNKNLHKEK